MSEVTYDGWSMFSQVTIVENSGRWGQKLDLPQGYICDSSNKKMLAAAQSWARWYNILWVKMERRILQNR